MLALMVKIGSLWANSLSGFALVSYHRAVFTELDYPQHTLGVPLEAYGGDYFGIAYDCAYLGKTPFEPSYRLLNALVGQVTIPTTLVQPYVGIGSIWLDDVKNWQTTSVLPLHFIVLIGLDFLLLSLFALGLEVNYLYHDFTEVFLYGFTSKNQRVIFALTLKIII